MIREEWDHETWHGDIWADVTENLKPQFLLNLWLREVASFSLKEKKQKEKEAPLPWRCYKDLT